MVREAIAEDAAPLAEMARRVFHATFAADNDPADMAVYLAEAFGERRQAAEIADPRMRTFVAEAIGGRDATAGQLSKPVQTPQLIGYVQLQRGEPPECVSDRDAVEIKRFYVDHSWHGRGVARRLMEAALAAASENRPPWRARTIWLGVWERNPQAIAFYRKCGFTHVGEHAFLFGRDVQSDWVMVRAI